MAKQQALLVATALVLLVMGAISSVDATCTAVNHSSKPVQLQLLPSVSAAAGVAAAANITTVVDVAVGATVPFALELVRAIDTIALIVVNKLTGSLSPTLAIVNGAIIRVENSLTDTTKVNAFLDISISGSNIVTVATLIANL